MSGRILHGDCRTILPTLDADSFDACVTDPPYHLTSMSRGGSPRKNDIATPYGRTRLGEAGFMGKTWDGGDVAQDPATWATVLRVLKPAAHLVAFSGTRTYHRMVCAIEDAGFEIRDQIGWAYGQGFPKSKNLSGEWDGWGTALKPAWEPIVVARKPLSEKTVEANVARWGTGAINVDGCRIPSGADHAAKCASVVGLLSNRNGDCYGEWTGARQDSHSPLGRWPANLIHDGSQGVLDLFPETKSGVKVVGTGRRRDGDPDWRYAEGSSSFGDSGSAARFFYCAKASASDRAGSKHPTVKPRALMRYLCRLVTPPGSRVLDPFAGSGTTLYAARDEGFDAVGIELDQEYAAHIEERLDAARPTPTIGTAMGAAP